MSVFNALLSNIDQLELPSKSWGTHIAGEKIALIAIKPSPFDGFVDLFKSIVLYENEEQQLQVTTTILQMPIKVAYLNYDIKDITDLQTFLNQYEKVQFCKYFIADQYETCETIGKDFSNICANCETATNNLEINQQCNKENSLSHVFECNTCFSSLEATEWHSYVSPDNQSDLKDKEKPASKTEPDCMCQICGSKWDSPQELLEHEKAHFNGNLVCVVCHKDFNLFQRLVVHTKKYHPNVPFINCHLCKKKFSTARHLRVHLRSHTDNYQNLSCSKCTLKFHSQIQLNLHKKYHKTDTTLTCRKCNKKLTHNKKLLLHLLTEHPKPFYPCRICHRAFETKLLLLRHEETHEFHVFECKPCSKQFKSYNDFVDHKLAHQTANRYICPNCRKSFPTLNLAEAHACALESYKCKKCDKEFNQLQAFKMHCRRHGMQNTFECNVCNKSFSTRGNLANHTQKHEREVSSEEGSAELVSAAATEEM